MVMMGDGATVNRGGYWLRTVRCTMAMIDEAGDVFDNNTSMRSEPTTAILYIYIL